MKAATPRPLNIQSKMKRRTKAFADNLIDNPKHSATTAYLATHETTNRNAARVEASKLLSKPAVSIYLSKHIDMAKRRIVELTQSDREDVALRASQDVIDREYGKATQQVEVRSQSVQVLIDLTATSSEHTHPTHPLNSS